MDVQGLKSYVTELVLKCGSQAEIARKCGISSTALSQWLNGKYKVSGNGMNTRIARELQFVSNRLKTVESVYSYQQVKATYLLAKNARMWKGISSPAGTGKSQALFDLYLKSSDNSVVYLRCGYWNSEQFLEALCKVTKGLPRNMSARNSRYRREEYKSRIVDFVWENEEKKPIFLIDEANKSLNSAIAELIDLENQTNGYLGLILAGTETLENRIHLGATRTIKTVHMDELESRLGRDFTHLWGATEQNVYDMCAANGVADYQTQQFIWQKLPKTEKKVPIGKNGKEVIETFTDDFRCMTQLIQEELLFRQVKEGFA